MFALRRLSVFLPTMPRSEQNATEVAAVPFNLPPWLDTGAQWSDLADTLAESITIVTTLIDGGDRQLSRSSCSSCCWHPMSASTPRRPRGPRRIDAALAHRRGPRRPGLGRRRRPSDLRPRRTRPFLEPATRGIHRRENFGDNIATPSPGGGDAPIVTRLKVDMPQDRPQLALESDEFKLIERWIADNRPA